MLLPDFELAPLEGIDPGQLIHGLKDKLGELVLALALAYNDLKDAEYALYQTNQLRARSQLAPLAEFGQLNGMRNHALRRMTVVAHEVLERLRKDLIIIKTSGFQALVAKLPSSHHADWLKVLDVVTGADRKPNAQDSVSQLLEKIRHNMGSHYQPGGILKGYLEYFRTLDPTRHADKAVVSIGNRMETTRFYFADAAAAGAIVAQLAITNDDYNMRLGKICERLNMVLYGIVRAFVETRAPTRQPYPSPQTPP
jgi:hypothetical protein